MPKKVAIIGGGLSGLVLAKNLDDFSKVTVFEKSSGVAGRMATRLVEPFEFDHGAQFFTARSEAFKNFLLPYLEKETVVAWNPKVVTLEEGKKPYKRSWFETHYIAQPRMTSLVKALGAPVDIRFNTKIDEVFKQNNSWSLKSAGKTIGEGFDWLISSAPGNQAFEIFNKSGITLKGLDEVEYSPCFALMVGLYSELSLGFDAAVVKNSPIKWIAANSTKYGRRKEKALVIHSCNKWAFEKINEELPHVQSLLENELFKLTDVSAKDVSCIDMARWRYAKVERESPQGVQIDRHQRVAVCGDWCRGNRVEDAYLSGVNLSERLRLELDR